MFEILNKIIEERGGFNLKKLSKKEAVNTEQLNEQLMNFMEDAKISKENLDLDKLMGILNQYDDGDPFLKPLVKGINIIENAINAQAINVQEKTELVPAIQKKLGEDLMKNIKGTIFNNDSPSQNHGTFFKSETKTNDTQQSPQGSNSKKF